MYICTIQNDLLIIQVFTFSMCIFARLLQRWKLRCELRNEMKWVVKLILDFILVLGGMWKYVFLPLSSSFSLHKEKKFIFHGGRNIEEKLNFYVSFLLLFFFISLLCNLLMIYLGIFDINTISSFFNLKRNLMKKLNPIWNHFF